MTLKNIKPGTKLVWDAPEPYEGYSRYGLFKKDGKVGYIPVYKTKKEAMKHTEKGKYQILKLQTT